MAGVNKAILVGNLGHDPSIRYAGTGTAITKFSLATTEKFKDEKKTEWHNIVTFGKLAEVCAEWLTKGKAVYIEGRIETRKWDDKDGNTKYMTEIIANTMQMLGGREDKEPRRKPTPNDDYRKSDKPGPKDEGYSILDQAKNDDIPF